MRYKIESRHPDLTCNTVKNLSPLPHIHSHLELIYMIDGQVIANVDNKDFLIEAGDLFLSFPNQIHYYHDYASLDGIILIFSPELFKDLREIFQNKVPDSPIIKSSLISFDVHKHLMQILEKNHSDAPFGPIAAKGYLLAFLGEILPLMKMTPARSDQDNIKRLLQYCADNYTEPLTLDGISRQLHLNKYYISHVFKERMNIGFTDFVNNLRTEHACNLLEEGVNITEVAFASGFSSIRTFNRCFSQNIGMTPREYIKMKIQS